MGEAPHGSERGSSAGPLRKDPRLAASLARYWRSNLRIMFLLLAIWAIVGLGCGVLLADVLADLQLGGYPLGFWFAQQGSILVFIVLIFVYAFLLNRLDTKHHVEIETIRATPDDRRT